MEGPWGLGLPSHTKGSKDDPPSSHFRCHLGLSVLTPARGGVGGGVGGTGCSPFWG